jgi:hypothetical protein
MYLFFQNGQIKELKYPSELSMRFFLKNSIGHQATFIKRDLLLKHGLYDESYHINADYDFWLKTIIEANCSVKQIPLYLSYYDMHGISSNQDQNDLCEVKKIQEKYLSPLVIKDLHFFLMKEKDMEIFDWYHNQRVLYGMLVIIYKIVKNIRKLTGLKY